MELNKIYNEDCLIGMKSIPDRSIDMILCDLPYGTIRCHWDTIIPFKDLWEHYERIIKQNGAIVLFSSQPFTSALIMSNPNLFRYEWIWEKSKASNFLNAKKQPLKAHENILVFGIKSPLYYPQKTKGEPFNKGIRKSDNGKFTEAFGAVKINKTIENKDGFRLPRSVQYFVTAEREGKLHPTQKPIALIEYLIKTYTIEGEIVLDNCIGSGTTAIGCINTNRNFIGFENNKEYFDIANKRITQKQKI
jgi:site-specific DNA-methyltransferase (adenine-specific)